ncbi:MAG: zinc ribbon domain-containing protein, partial [Thermoplasmata archaeon]
MVVGGLVLVVAAAPPASLAPSAPAVVPAAPVTHSDLVVASGQNYTIQPSGGTPDYYQGGNITVEAGGTLNVQNVSLIFVQFVTTTGTTAQRLSHIYTFSDAGTVNFYNSTLTTDLGVLNAWAKLNLQVTGTMTLWNSHFEFPGWVTASGTSADLTLNNSEMTSNPAVATLKEPLAIQGDTSYAASLLATGGAKVNLFHSVVNATYADNTTRNGLPGSPTVNATDVALDRAGTNVTDLSTPGNASDLTLDYLNYRNPISLGDLGILYSNTGNNTTTNGSVSVWFDGLNYPVGPLSFTNKTFLAYLQLPLPSELIAAVNSVGALGLLNSTGSFGTPSALAVQFSALTGGVNPISLDNVGLQFDAELQYNLVANGTGTTVTSVDSSLDLNYNNTPTSPNSLASPFPWTSNKFLFDNGSTGYLANVSTPSRIPGVYSASAVQTDPASTVYFYRWAGFNLTSSLHQNISGATVTAYYAYDDNQVSNATANALNDIEATNPAMWGYLLYWDHVHGASGYGVSNGNGQAGVLLAASEVTNASLPTGVYLGSYHVDLRAPYVNNTTWINFAVSPYPTGVANGTHGYESPDWRNVTVVVAPPSVKFISFTVPPSTLNLNDIYASTGVISISGPGAATVTVVASPIGGGGAVTLAYVQVLNGSFDFEWNNGTSLQNHLQPGTTYTIAATATYRTATPAVFNFPGTYSVPASTSASGFLYEKFLGLPLWLWLAIAAAAVVAILVVLLLFRRQAAGKLVECGECGELIPEDATACPKCGAEFESDLVRCSRCSSTIPANSQFCPECSAQLLGKPGEGESDPERQAYADFTERFRAEGKKELGDNYTEGSFWDWWKRQPTYVPFSQWKVQQTKGAPRAGMSEPPTGSEVAADAPRAAGGMPPKGGAP